MFPSSEKSREVSTLLGPLDGVALSVWVWITYTIINHTFQYKRHRDDNDEELF
jgi:hypothetical protein